MEIGLGIGNGGHRYTTLEKGVLGVEKVNSTGPQMPATGSTTMVICTR